jgi:hypothetical protein
LPPLGVLDIVLDDIIDESVAEEVLPMSGEELAAGIAVVLESAAMEELESAAAVLSVLLAGCEHPARARPAMADRMTTVEPIGVRPVRDLKGDMRKLRLNLAKTLAAQSRSKR